LNPVNLNLINFGPTKTFYAETMDKIPEFDYFQMGLRRRLDYSQLPQVVQNFAGQRKKNLFEESNLEEHEVDSRKKSLLLGYTKSSCDPNDYTEEHDIFRPVYSDSLTDREKIWLMVLIGGLNFGNSFLVNSMDSLEPILQNFYKFDSESIAMINYAVIVPKILGLGLAEKFFLRQYGFLLPVMLVGASVLGQVFVAFGITENFLYVAMIGNNFLKTNGYRQRHGRVEL
jgi:hypothetical protein